MNRFGTVFCALLLASLSGHAQGIITTVAGNGTPGFSGDGGPATSAQLSFPDGIAVDASGNLYIADSNNMRVRRVNPAGIITTIAGNGLGDFTGDVGPATSNSLWFPSAVAGDGAGNVYIVDAYNLRIRKVTPSGHMTTVAGGGPCCSLRDGGPATRAALGRPEGVAVDSTGNIYIADSLHNRIRKVTPNGIITTVAGYGGGGNHGDGGPATSAALSSPEGVAVEAAGNLYIAFLYGVRKVSPSGIITTVAGGGSLYSLTDGVPATSVYLQNIQSVAVDAAGNLYLTQFDRVRKVNAAGIISTVAGGGFSLADGVPAISASLSNVRAVAVDAAGNLYISEGWNNRVRKVTFS